LRRLVLCRCQAEPGSTIEFGRVLAHKTQDGFKVGRPYLTDVVVQAEVLEEIKGPKITVGLTVQGFRCSGFWKMKTPRFI
jgi:ribosomal protein L21